MNPVTLGEKVANAKPYGINVDRMIAPANNLNGVVIRTAMVQTGGTHGILSTGKTPPTGYTDTTVPVLLTGGLVGQSVLPFEVQIPAGYGLWFVKGSQADGYAFVTYDLL